MLSCQFFQAAVFFRALGPNRDIWAVVKIMVPVWVLIIIRHLAFRVPKKGP